jgi:RimJ/RimL family protein N-acetyltransferase
MYMSSIARIEGPNLTLRLIEPDDAAYVHGLRTNPLYNSHLSKVTGSVEDQRQWIEGYKEREAAGQEFYYVIERKDDGTRCGLVRLYDIEADSFTWGSWILDENKPPKAALESTVLSFSVGFEMLRRELAKVDVRVDNTHATAFYRRLGMTETHRTAQDIYFSYPRVRFAADRPIYLKLLSEH